MGRKEGFTARKVVHSDRNKTERNTLKKSASQPLHQVVKTTKHPSDSFSQQNEAEEATQEEEEEEEDVAAARSGKTTTMQQKKRREVATRGASEALSATDGRSCRQVGRGTLFQERQKSRRSRRAPPQRPTPPPPYAPLLVPSPYCLSLI
jgi:hypothetical protein